MGFNCLKATEPLRGGSLPFTTKFPESPDTHFIDLRKKVRFAKLCNKKDTCSISRRRRTYGAKHSRMDQVKFVEDSL